MKERMRNRFKIYQAPKATISLKVFKQAIASRKQAEALAEDAQTWTENNQENDLGCVDGAVEGHTAVADGSAGNGAHTALRQVSLACMSDQTRDFSRPKKS